MPAIGALESSAECWRRTLSSTFPSIRDLAHLTDPRARAQAIGRLLAEHQAALMDLARLRREAVAELRSAGLTQAQVAQVLGVTPGRVAQLEPETAGRPPVLGERGILTDPLVEGGLPARFEGRGLRFGRA